MSWGHPHPFETHRRRPSATWPGGIVPEVNPVPVEPFTRAYDIASLPGKTQAVKSKLGGLSRKATGGWAPGSTLTAAEWAEVDRLLDELSILLAVEDAAGVPGGAL